MSVRRVLPVVLPARVVGIGLGLVALVGTPSRIGAAQDLRPLADRTRAIELPGLSVLPPSGEDWFLLPVTPQERVFGKPVSPEGLVRFVRRLPVAVREQDARQVVAAVLVKFGPDRAWTPREFLEAFTGPDPKADIGRFVAHRQRLLNFDARLDDAFGATCVRYSRLTEIHGQFPAFPELVADSSTEGLYCYHPFWPHWVIDVTYQQNYPQNQTPLAGDADAFLKGIHFTHERPHAADGADSSWQTTPSSRK